MNEIIKELEEIAAGVARSNKIRADQLRALIPSIRAELVRLKGDAYASEATVRAQTGMLEHSITRMVDRFLTWPVPASVYPDGIPGQPGRTGTNLLTATEARAMLEYVLGGATLEKDGPGTQASKEGAEPSTSTAKPLGCKHGTLDGDWCKFCQRRVRAL